MKAKSVFAMVIPICACLALFGCSAFKAGEHLKAGDELLAQGQLEEAIAEYDEAIRLDPQFALAYNNRGFANTKLGQYARAIQDYDEAIRLDPWNPDSNAGRAMTYTLLGKDKEAQQDVERAVGLGFDRGLLEGEIEDAKMQR